MKKIKNYINGTIKSLSENFLEIEDPSTGDKIGEVVLSSKKDFDNWRKDVILWYEINNYQYNGNDPTSSQSATVAPTLLTSANTLDQIETGDTPLICRGSLRAINTRVNCCS